jgi:hypothetical protein
MRSDDLHSPNLRPVIGIWRASFLGGGLKKKKRRRQIGRIERLIDKWATRLGLRWWHRIEFAYPAFKKSASTAMRTTVRWEYLRAEIEVNLRVCALLSDGDLEHIFLHEMAHILVAEMRDGDQKNEERTCTRLAQAFMWIDSSIQSP